MRSGGECVEASEGVRKRRRLGGSAPTSVTRRTRVVVHACGVARKSDARRASRVRTSGNTARTPIEVARVASLASAVVERKQHFGPFEKIWTARVPFKCWRAFQVICRRPTNSPPNSRFGSAPTLERDHWREASGHSSSARFPTARYPLRRATNARVGRRGGCLSTDAPARASGGIEACAELAPRGQSGARHARDECVPAAR